MALPTNGTARKALITGAIGLAFAGIASVTGVIWQKVAWLESEAYRVGKIAAGRGERIDRLERYIDQLQREMVDIQRHHAVIEYRASERRLR